MENINDLAIWYLIGFISTNLITYFLEKELTVKDILFSLFFAFFGVIVIGIGFIIFIQKIADRNSEKINKILDKKVI